MTCSLLFVPGLKGEELGTPGFMAPEAMRKKGNDSAFDEKVGRVA